MEFSEDKKIIAIVGLMGVGKTTIGMKLAEKLNYYFIDSDQEIEDRTQSTVTEIFKQKGEKYFRSVEKDVIKNILASEERVVLSLGGGAFVDKELRALIKEKAITVWLFADVDVVLQRIGHKSDRPLLNGVDKRKMLSDLAKKRYPIYAEADISFDTASKSNDHIIQAISKIVDKKRLANVVSKVVVRLGSRSYNINIGCGAISYLFSFLQEKKYSKIVVISDSNVASFYLAKLEAVLQNKQIACESVVVEAGEAAKSFTSFEKVCEEVLQKNIDRKTLIVAFGGGVVGDLAGFVASVLLRGIDFVQVPTTLLAMVDSSVGGKTAINSKFGKNLIGSFYQPKLVICDLNFLTTLPSRELRAGYAEVLKYGLIYDKNFFEFLETNIKKSKMSKSATTYVTQGFSEEMLQKMIVRSCEIKAEIVVQDEREQDVRALLNFGHNFAHIFEAETGYSAELLHGEAVALGMLLEAKMSLDLKMLDEVEFLRIKEHLQKMGFILSLKDLRRKWNLENLRKYIFKDKKNQNGNLTFVLLEKIGKAVVRKSVPFEVFDKVLVGEVG